MRNSNRLSKRLIVPLSLLLTSSIYHSSFASGVAVNGTAARAESMQAFTAVADDPSAVYYNPAGLTQIKGTEIYGSLALIMPSLQYTNAINGVSTSTHRVSVGGSLFASTDKWNPLILGLGIYAPDARASSYSINPATFGFPLNGYIARTDITPTVAFDINQNISLGASIVGSRVGLSDNVLGLVESGYGYGVTGQAGMLIKLPNRVQLGLNYRGPMDARITGSGNLRGLMSDNFVSHINFPDVISAGAAWKVIDPVILSISYQYERWSRIASIARQYNNPIINQLSTLTVNGKDVGIFSIGGQYKAQNNDEYRLGYSYMPTAVPQNTMTPILADFDTHVFAAGYSHYYKNWRFDATYEYSHMLDQSGTFAVFPGSYKMHLNSVLLGVSYTIC